MFLISSNRPGEDYQNEEYKRAHDWLQQAMAKINKKITVSFESFLPEAPAGWRAEESKSESISFTATEENVRIAEAKRRYIHKSDEKQVDIVITNTPRLLEPYLEMAESMPVMKGLMEQQGITSRQEVGWYIFIEKLSEANYKLTAVHKNAISLMEGICKL